MADPDQPSRRRYSGRAVVLVTAAIVFGAFAVSFVIYVTINPAVNLYVEQVSDCSANTTDCGPRPYVVLDSGSIANLTVLSRALDAFDHPANYTRAVKVGNNLTYETSRAAASELLGFLRNRLAQENPGLVQNGTYGGNLLLRFDDRVFRFSMGPRVT